jgi:tetratricopeptide (TPR) repeat protein
MAWVAGAVLAVGLGAAGFWVGGALGAGVGVAAGVVAPLLVELIRQRAEADEVARRVEPAARRLGPASLLDPALELVPFTGRTAELAALRKWCTDDDAGAVRLVVGGGGAGKTRLALELKRRLGDAGGWRCADIDAGTEANALEAVRAAAGRRRLLLVVDYADARAGLVGLLDAVARDPTRVRVLLLARHAGEWWRRLEGSGQAARDMAADAGREVITLADAVTGGSPVDIVLSALPWFAARLGVEVGDIGVVRVTHAESARILDLHAAALVAVLGAPERPGTTAVRIDVSKVLDMLLGHEQHYWQDTGRALKLFDVAGGLSAGQLSQAIAAMCLLGAATEDEAAGLSGRVPGAVPSMAVALWLRGLYPPDGESLWLGSLRPDRLAELHVTRELGASPVLTRKCLSELTERQAQQALVLLARASADHPEAEPLLESALYRFPEVPAGIKAPRETLIAVANSIPFPSLALAETDASLTSRIAATYPAGTTERASWQETSSTLLAAIGRPEDALAAAEEAVTIRRDLASARPEAFLPDLAMSLDSLSGCLSALGRREEALAAIEEAVATYRDLAGARPKAFVPDLAGSLNNLSGCLGDLGRREEALAAIEEAVTAYRDLAGTRPEAFLPGLAGSLNNLSGCLGDLGRREEALAAIEEAVTIRRDQAGSRPDVFLPSLATSLHNQSSRLGDLGRREEALAAIEEALAIRRDLAAARSEAFSPDLAGSLNTQSSRLDDLGRPQEALAAIEEAVTVYRDLAAARPEAFRPGLAMSLNTQSNQLADLGRPQEALAAIEEAVTIRRDQAGTRPEVFLPDLAVSLNNMSGSLTALGREEDALAVIEEAVSAYRDLAGTRPEVFLPGLAGSLYNMSDCLDDLGREEEALAVIEEAVGAYRDLAAARPEVFLPNLAMSLNNQSSRLSDLGRREEGLRAIEEAVTIRRGLTQARPAEFAGRLASSLKRQAAILSALGRETEAKAARDEADCLDG